jgi:hypothetical protein
MAQMPSPATISAPEIRCQLISSVDIPAVVALLRKGFEDQRDGQFWEHMFLELSQLHVPDDVPRFGYMLEHRGRPVGVLLLISGPARAKDNRRCNPSSWYVEPEYRAFASLLVSRALRDRAMTYMNVSPAPHTWPILEIQGFRRYVEGLFVSVPSLSGPPSEDVAVVEATAFEDFTQDPFERELLVTHARLGCVSVWCKTSKGAYPFVFRTRMLRHVVPCFQLVYCREIAEFVRLARPLGWYLLRRGRPFVLVDANGPVPGLVGRYCSGLGVKYYKGPYPPRLGDLSYTETSLFGV